MTIQQVQEFHRKFDLPDGEADNDHMTKDVREFRSGFMQEELNEFKDAMFSVDAFDALLDLAYVVYGTALFMGISPEQWDKGMAVVHAANMTKIRAKADASNSKRGSSFDVVKPKGFVGPEEKLKEIITNRATGLQEL